MMNLTDREAVLGRVRSLLRRQEDEVEALNAVRHRIASHPLTDGLFSKESIVAMD